MTIGQAAAFPRCGAWLQPDVVWFGRCCCRGLATAERAAAECDAFSASAPRRSFTGGGPPLAGQTGGAVLVEINRDGPRYRGRSTTCCGTAGEILPALLAAIGQ